MKRFMNDEFLLRFIFPSSESARRALMAWLHWPFAELRAVRISTHEVPREGQIFPASDDGVADAIQACPIGFFLFGPRKQWKVNVTFSKQSQESTIDYWLSDRTNLYRLMPQLVELFDAYCMEYAYAGHFEEIVARHQLRINLGATKATQALVWCGRDFRRYIPGLYWYNYFSDHYCTTMRIDPAQLADLSCGGYLRHANGHSVRMYDNPCEWQAHHKTVSEAMDRLENVFRRERVVIPEYVEYRDINDWIYRTGQKWP